MGSFVFTIVFKASTVRGIDLIFELFAHGIVIWFWKFVFLVLNLFHDKELLVHVDIWDDFMEIIVSYLPFNTIASSEVFWLFTLMMVLEFICFDSFPFLSPLFSDFRWLDIFGEYVFGFRRFGLIFLSDFFIVLFFFKLGLYIFEFF